jgi:Uncharacterised nucleotidyltransferase
MAATRGSTNGALLQGPEEHTSITQAARSLRADITTAEVTSAFEESGIRSILLKGPVLNRWLYADGMRPYRDSDLLVAPADITRAEEILARRGFEHAPLDDLTFDRPWHAHAWIRARDGANVDLHRTLIGVGAGAEKVWSVLWAQTQQALVEGTTAQVLAPPALALHVALHAAQDGRRLGSPLEDLRRALDQVNDATWRAAAALAEELDAGPAFAAGLREDAAGIALAERLELATTTTMEIALRARAAPQLALSVEWLTRAPTLRAKVALVASKVFPPPAYMRSWAPIARRGRLWMASAYLWRVVWMALQAPAALRAWLSAKQDVRRK